MKEMDIIRVLVVLMIMVITVVVGKALDRVKPDTGAVQFKGSTFFEETRPDANTVCYGVLGCFSNNGEFADFLHRPIPALPYSPSFIQTKFTLLTRENEVISQQLKSWDDASIKSSNFTAMRKTKFIIHGYLNNKHSPWVKDMAKALLSVGDYNVILVDWILGAVDLYQQSAANTRVVGAEVWYLCSKLTKLKGMKNKDVHLIGHSLGAHVSGYAGHRMPGLGRISGLDPAEPYFQGMGPLVRLDPTDAEFVDVIHTDGDNFLTKIGTGGYGMSQACGHVDFYPNGGRDQPQCDTEDTIGTAANIGILQGLRHFLTCNHMRAIYLYTESITKSSCQFTAFPCRDYETFLKGQCGYCGKRCAQMGYYADQVDRDFMAKVENTYFLQTAGYPNYCRHNYILNLKTKSEMESANGEISVNIKTGSQSTGFMALTKGPIEIDLFHSFVMESVVPIDESTVLTLQWKAQHTWLGLGIVGHTGRETLHVDFIKIDGSTFIVEVFDNAIVQPGSTVSNNVKFTRRLKD